jgi:hypothetical protein
MNRSDPVRVVSVPPSPTSGRRLLRLICTNNPFYVLSAGLFLVGLWVSFGAQSEEVQTWALMSGLSCYTLLLAVTACLLVRFGNVWDDVRTVLLLVVLMFLATSVTFDEVLVFDPVRGSVCYLLGFLFTIAVSEGLLRGCRLSLPLLFRVPYYLILALYFLYPVALRPLLSDPRGEALAWGLFGISPLAGLAFLTLLPAIRRGADYVRDNGSPWHWPLYPWVLFGLLGCAVPARAFLLCWSMQLLDHSDFNRVLFGPFFIAPFGLVVAVLLLEIGLVCRRQSVLGTALALPALLVLLTVFAHREDPIYREFLTLFAARVSDPLSILLLAAAGFYAYAASRGVRGAFEALTGTLLALTFVGPDTLDERVLVAPQLMPLLAASVLQFGFGLMRRNSWRCLIGLGLLATVALFAPDEGELEAGAVIAFHVILVGLLLLGAAFDDRLGRFLRVVSVSLVTLIGLTALSGALAPSDWLPGVYVLLLAVVLLGYGKLVGLRSSFLGAAVLLTAWLGVAGWRAYCWLRQLVTGLDQMLLSLALFGLALLVSLIKSGILSRWLQHRQRRLAQALGISRSGGGLPSSSWSMSSEHLPDQEPHRADPGHE